MRDFYQLTNRGRALVLANYILEDPSPDYRTAAPEYFERWEKHLRAFLDRSC
jgi:hypothetical protein